MYNYRIFAVQNQKLMSPGTFFIKKSVLWVTCLLFFTVIVSLSGCKSDPTDAGEPDKKDKLIDLYIRFLEGEKMAKVTATFQEKDEDGKLMPYEEPVKMWFQGRSLEAPTGGRRPNAYLVELDGIEPDVFEYVIESRKNKPEIISLDMSKKSPPKVVSFSISDGFQVDMTGTPLSEGQSLIVVVTDERNTSASMTITGPFKGLAILPTSNFENLTIGEVTLYMVLKSRDTANLSGYFAEIDKEYYFSEVKTDLIR
jgi:hypothetical protein